MSTTPDLKMVNDMFGLDSYSILKMNLYTVIIKNYNLEPEGETWRHQFLDTIDYRILFQQSNSQIVYQIKEKNSKFVQISSISNSDPDQISVALIKLEDFGLPSEQIKLIIYILNLALEKTLEERIFCKKELELSEADVQILKNLLSKKVKK